MKPRLNKAENMLKRNVFWGVLYVVILVAFSLAVFLVTDRMQTHIIPNGQIELNVPYSKYLQGETVSFSIKNNFDSSVYVINGCPGEPLAVYKRVNSKWIRIHDQASESDCPEEQRKVSVAAGTTVNGNFKPWHNLFSEPGNYRIVAYVENYNALPYQDFEVVAKPTPEPANGTFTSTTPVTSVVNTEAEDNNDENEHEDD